ncbi:hypothetical protein ACFO3J_21405 [Streptomyces polygonati]|uniref:WD40 repeat protein n=1 Tax=Streptomyces polygonati TaxID=1617087 RepID=A0ABV8HSY5_9ACTN
MPERSRRFRNRRSTAIAIALTAGLTAGACLLLSACDPNTPAADGSAGPSAVDSGTAKPGSAPATGSGGPGKGDSSKTGGSKTGGSKTGGSTTAADARPAASSAPVLNGTSANGLTISDGTRFVVMNGTRVDFGTPVRDLAWSPDGKKAAFIDGDGDLVTAGPDGGGRVVVAENPGDQNWSHPAWQVRPYDAEYQMPALSNLLFAVRTAAGVSKLYGIPSGSVHGTPRVLRLNAEGGPGIGPLPQTGNVWPSGGGKYGDAVYANTADGQVYIRDDNVRQQGSAIAAGSEPAADPAGDGIVFVRSVGGHDHLFLERDTQSGPVVKDLTPGAATDYTEPAWSPNGTTIAARTPAGIVTLPADGSHAPVKVSGYQGLPAYRAS